MLVALRRMLRAPRLEQESLRRQRACRDRPDDKKQNNFCEVTHHSIIGSALADLSCQSFGG
jgi:hypothetical protein